MTFDLRGKTMLITGASTGIGAAVALGAARAGADVAIHYNRSANAAERVHDEAVAAGSRAETYQADLTRVGAAADLVERVASSFGRLDVLVNNAGSMLGRTTVEEMTTETYERLLDVNLRHVVEASRAAIPHLRRSEGCVVNVGSIAARTGGGAGAGVYAATKGAVASFTRGLAKELASEGIRVNAISPGLIRTPFHEGLTTDEQFEHMAGLIPMGRPGTAEDLVGPTLFLASDAVAGFVTGQLLEVNGGQFSP